MISPDCTDLSWDMRTVTTLRVAVCLDARHGNVTPCHVLQWYLSKRTSREIPSIIILGGMWDPCDDS